MEKTFVKIGHRGAMGYEPENTSSSIKKALLLGCDMIEIDVHLCKTGELVVIHDETLDRTTNGKGRVKDFTLSELKKLDAGNGEQILTLIEVLDLINKRSQINIELKGIGTAEKVAQLIINYIELKDWNKEHFLVSSFNHQELVMFKKILPQIKTGVLIYHLPHDLAKIGEELSAYSLNVSGEFLTKELVEDAHERNLKLFVYTVNNPADIKTVKGLGVDGIFSNYPDRLN